MSEYKIQEYNQTAAALSELRARYSRKYDVSTTAGMTEAKAARAAVRGYRVALEKTRIEIKAPALERTRLIDAEAKRITAELMAIEEPIDAAIKAEEQRKIEEKAAKERAEASRIEAIKFRIDYFSERVIAASNRDSKTITAILKDVEAAKLDEQDYQEMLPNAISAKITAVEKLEAMLTERIFYEQQCERIKAEQEAESARIQAEREELARLRAADEERQAEERRIAEANRLEAEAKLAAERQRHEAELRAQREQQEREAREAKALRDAEEKRIRAEQEAMEKQRAELEARRREEEAKQRKSEIIAAITSIAEVKEALKLMTILPGEAIDKAYEIGFNAGYEAE
jgi:colicin import membrane protein